MSGVSTSTNSGVPRTRLERLRAGEFSRSNTAFGRMTPDQRLQSVARAMFDRGDFAQAGLSGPGTIARAFNSKSVGTQTGSDLLNATTKLGPLSGAGAGGEYLSFLKSVYNVKNTGELVRRFQKDLNLEPQGLYKEPVMYRQSTQIMKGLGKSRSPCEWGNAIFE